MRVLVTGGAGYIGSHTVVQLARAGHEVSVVDDFSNSRPSAMARVSELAGRDIPLESFDVGDVERLGDLMDRGRFDAVVHFAAYKAVGESVEHPIAY